MSSVQKLCLADDLTIYHAVSQKNQLLEALFGCNELELDLSAVNEIDTAGLQLLIMLKKEAQHSGKRLSIVAHSQPVRNLIDFCNLAAELGDPLVIPAAEAA